MKPRKLIPSILLILILLFTFVALSFSQVRQQYLRDFSYLSADLRHMQQKVDDFIDDLKRGDLRAFQYITYDVLERAVLQIKDEAMRYRQQIVESYESEGKDLSSYSRTGVPFMEYLMHSNYGNAPRANLVRCSLRGLFNLDPRVRLTAVHFLRKLRPDPSMQRLVKTAIGIDSDWISYNHNRRDYEFKAPRRLETVASRWEYYREHDLNWPTDVNPGIWGLNDHIHPNLNDRRANNMGTTTELSAARWGERAPRVYGDAEYLHFNLGAGRADVQTPGYTRMADDEKMEYMKKVREGMLQVRQDDGTLGWEELRFDASDDVEAPMLPESAYRRYHTQEGPWGHVDLYSYQAPQGASNAYVPMGHGPLYTYVNCDGYRVQANPYAETAKLDEFVTRIVWYNKIKRDQRNCLAIISKDTFSTLWRSIDGEMPEHIPFLSTATHHPMLNHEDVDVIINGLHRNKNLLNKWVMMRSLKDIYKFTSTPERIKEDINVALWEARREINRRSYVHGLVLTKESIRVGKLDPVNEHEVEHRAIYEVEQKGTRTIEREELGFRLPNDEIRANGYRLLVDGPSEKGVNIETKLSLEELREYRIYAYKDERNDIIDYYRNKEEYFRLHREYHSDVPYDPSRERDLDAGVEPSRKVININLLRRSQALIDALLSGNGNMWKTAQWPEVETAVLLTLYRVMVKYKNNGGNEYITTFMDQLRSQDPLQIDEQAVAGEYPNDTYSDSKRENIMRASLVGLFNRDPRIRLQCIHFLRRIGPSEDMMEDVIRARNVMATDTAVVESPETDDYRSAFIDTNVYERKASALVPEERYRYEGIDEAPMNDDTYYYTAMQPTKDYTIKKYEYQSEFLSIKERDANQVPMAIDYYGQYQLKAPSEELNKLYKFCLRDQIVGRIKAGEVEAITRMTRAEFSVIAEVIDDEFILRVPFASFYADPLGGQQNLTIQILRGTRVETTAISRDVKSIPGKYAIFTEQDLTVIRKGIDSTNFLVQKGTAEFMIRFYEFYPALEADKKRLIQDALYFYKQDDIVVEEIVLAFEGQNPDGRAVILVGPNRVDEDDPNSRLLPGLAVEMNPGGVRIYKSLPDEIKKDIRDAILDEQEEFPEALINILGVIGRRSPAIDDRLTYERTEYERSTTGRSSSATVANPIGEPRVGDTVDNTREENN
jgi:hypothetical protein